MEYLSAGRAIVASTSKILILLASPIHHGCREHNGNHRIRAMAAIF
jgi:hypothetical protein